MDDSDIPGESTQQGKKRRFSRVSRACTECRLRKIRCDGRQPCEPCEDFNRRCVYSSTKAQRLGGAPRTKILEDRLRRARQLISQLQAENPSIRHKAEVDAIFETPPGSPSAASVTSNNGDADPVGDEDLENMMDGEGRFTTADDNGLAYFGGPSGFTFLQRTQQLFGDGPSENPQPSGPQHLAMTHLFDSPLPDKQALSSNVTITQLLPSRQTASRLLHVVFEQTHQLLHFLHEPSFHAQADRIYDLDPIDYADSDHDFLPFFFAVMAVGYLFDPERHKKYGCRRTIDQAMRHFIAARQMIDVTRCQDLTSLQTILCFVLFLMSSARLATAHTYVALAAAAAMRMGLHSQTTFNTITDEETMARRRIFWTIVKLDIYTGTILGLPGLVNLSHVDQIRPSSSVKDYCEDDEKSARFRNRRLTLAASAQYLDLLLIVSKMVQKLYPKTEEEARRVRKSKRMMISGLVVSEIEDEYKRWHDNLPAALNREEQPESPAMRRSAEMLQQEYLAPAAWQSVYTIFLAIVALIFFLATQDGAPDYANVQAEAETGIRILASTSCQDIGSRRCLDVMKVLVKRLSHMVELDIESIEKQVKSLCRLDASEETLHSQHNPASFNVPAATGGPSPWPATTAQRGSTKPLPSHHSTSHPPGNDGSDALLDPYTVSSNYGSGPNFMQNIPISAPRSQYEPSSSTFSQSGYGYGHPQHEMEVPFTDSFAWPFEPALEADSGLPMAQGSGGHVNYATNTSSLTSEAIAAFMKINPADEPFL